MSTAMKWVNTKDLAEPAQVRLFCLPHAGSGAAGFYRWKRLLPPEIAVCPIMLPGREARLAEVPLRTVEGIVHALHAELAPELQGPYAIFGHSMSALIALEWARRIQRDALPPPVCLFVSGRDAPQTVASQRQLHKLPDAEMVHALVAMYGGDAGMLLEDAELREVFLPILRADLEVVETYAFAAGVPLTWPVRAFAGVADTSVSPQGLAAWSKLTTGSFAAQRILGDHFFHLGAGQTNLLAAIRSMLSQSPPS